MVEIKVTYEGQLHCRAVHGPSGTVLQTDAPKDNMGKGESFSPSDLVATGLGTCILTILGIVAQRHNIDITGATATVIKEMTSSPYRCISRLPITITVPKPVSLEDRKRLENAAFTCPVCKSIRPDIECSITFHWAEK